MRLLHRLLACSVAALPAACARHADDLWSGYVEADYIYVAAPLGGTLQNLAVRRGQAVAAGAPLFTLESEAEQAARNEAAARAAASRSQALDAAKGGRAEELAVSQAQLARARAEAQRAQAEHRRVQALVAQGFMSQSRADDAATALREARQQVAERTAALQVARLPARDDARAAADASARAAEEALRQTEWRTRQKRQLAPADAQVADTFFRPGEWVQPGQPVVSLLPPAATRARFFVPEGELALAAMGQAVTLHCDGCGEPIPARIDFVATQPEYTPPVIYSNAQRARLVFMVEARPDPKDAARLKPGQPIDVRRATP
jgi:HlyD family secretion protein